jgi:hypothetical protein
VKFSFVAAPGVRDAAAVAGAVTERAAQHAMHDLMHLVEDWARAEHLSLAGWDNESANLERTITGYVAGDPEQAIYPVDAVVPQAPFRRGSRVVTSQAYLDEHYRVDHDVSPPVSPVEGEVIGVLHHYMQYSNRLPAATGQEDIAVATLDAHADEIVDQLGRLLATRLEGI